MAATTTAEAPRGPARRRLAGSLWRHPKATLGLLLAGPIGWLVIAYLGSLAVLFAAAFWHLDTFSGQVVQGFSLENFRTLAEEGVYRSIVARTVLIAAAVTVTDAILAFPIAFFMAKVARRRTRALLVIAVVMPLWSSYLVKVYAWRIILAEDGILNWVLGPFGLSGPGFGNVATWIVFSYLWLPYMILPVYAALERIPDSLLDASGDLGGGDPDRPQRDRAVDVVVPQRLEVDRAVRVNDLAAELVQVPERGDEQDRQRAQVGDHQPAQRAGEQQRHLGAPVAVQEVGEPAAHRPPGNGCWNRGQGVSP